MGELVTEHALIIGIDAGISGCAVVFTNRGKYVSHFFFKKVKLGTMSRIDLNDMATNFHLYWNVKRCFIEKVHARPNQGVSSMFNFGHATGCVEGCVAAKGFPLTHISPSVWKARFGFSGQDKDAPRVKLALRYPNIKDLQLKGRGQALADAICILHAGMDWNL